MFSRYHYLTASLNRNAACYCAFVEGEPVCFAGLMHRPHPKNPNIIGVSRNVTLPDWQGIGLAFVLCDALGAAVSGVGKVLHHYPAHPSFIRSLDKSDKWEMIQKPGQLATSGTGGNMLSKTGEERKEVHRVREKGGVAHGMGPNAQLKMGVRKLTGNHDPASLTRAGKPSNFARRGGRPCAVFRYVGPKMEDKNEAYKLLNGE